MGYYTSFDIQIVGCNYADPKTHDIEAEVAVALSRLPSWRMDSEPDQMDLENYVKNSEYPLYALVGGDVYKWYDCEADMLTISSQFPDLEFVVTGYGEERDDNWREFFKDGKSKLCQGHILYDSAPEWSDSQFDDEY